MRTARASVSRIYVETSVRTDMESLWALTQDPAQHQRWDLRFSEITPLPEPGAGAEEAAAAASGARESAEGSGDGAGAGPDGAPGPASSRTAPAVVSATRFRYATRVLPFLTVSGTGVSAGDRLRADGERTSALRFVCAHPLVLLAEGSGYWRYVPDGAEVRFLTGYQYRTRWGRVGTLLDRLFLRPAMGWATAWSFDRLRLWLERGVSPRRSLGRALAEGAVRLALLGLAAVLVLLAGPAVPVVALLGPWLGLGSVLLTVASGLVLAALVLLVPPLPGTPSAGRCLRTPPLRVRAPRLLASLKRP
ncbi:hypothetical protein [Streptomyces sp. NPDC007088]|uniref:hypothetical protein n=1 Tax=Streptomyces sp. NPDC007088 TaxID=3364773 RepID=UPI0036896571